MIIQLRFYGSLTLFFVLTGCYRIDILTQDSGTVHSSERSDPYKGFWSSVQHLELNRQYPDMSRDESLFLQALRAADTCNDEASDSLMFQLVQSSVDSTIQRIAFELWEERLTERGEWGALHDLHRSRVRSSKHLPAMMNEVGMEQMVIPEYPETLSVERSILDVPIVEVVVNGTRKRFWLDTGSSEMVLSRGTAEACGIAVIDTLDEDVVTATGTIQGALGILPSCSIGTFSVSNMPALILDDHYLNKSILGVFRHYSIDGIIGWRMLRNVRITFDLPEDRIIIERSTEGERSRRNVVWMEYPLMRFTTEKGDPMLFFFDTGAESSSAHPNILQHVSGLERSTRLIMFHGIGGRYTGMGESIDRLVLQSDNTRLSLSYIPVKTVGRQDFVRIDGVIGSDLLWKRRVIFDYPNRTFIIE